MKENNRRWALIRLISLIRLFLLSPAMGWDRVRRFFLFPALLGACLGVMSQPGAAKDVIVEVEGRVKFIGFADLDGDGLKDLVVMAAPPSPDEIVPSVQIFFQDKEGEFTKIPLPDRPLDRVFLMDLADLTDKPGKELLMVDGESVTILEFNEKGEAHYCPEPAQLTTLFHAPAHDCPFLFETCVDLDGNGYDDAILPTPDGYSALFSKGDGSFQGKVPLPGSPEWSVQHSENIYFSIMTLTSKMKALQQQGAPPLLVTEQGGKILGYQYQPGKKDFLILESAAADFGSFSNQVKEGTIEYSGVVFNKGKGSPRTFMVHSHRMGRTGLLAELKTTHTLYRFESREGKKEIHLEACQKIVCDGISAAPIFSDLNADGHDDLVLLFVKTTFLTKLLEMILDRVIITCQAYLYQPDDKRFSFEPDWSEEVSVTPKGFRIVGMEGLVRLDSDYTGDNRPDWVVFDTDRLVLRRGEVDSGWFSSQEVAFNSRPFYQIGGPFPGPLRTLNIDKDPCPEIITYGDNIVRIVHVR